MTTHYDGKCKLLYIAVGTTNPKMKPKRTYHIRTMKPEMKQKKDISNQNNETENENETENDTETEKDTENKTGNEITNQNNKTENETDATDDDAHRQLVISCEMDAKYGPHSGTYGLRLCKPRSFAHRHPDTSPLLIAAELSHMQRTLPILPSRVFTSARMESV